MMWSRASCSQTVVFAALVGLVLAFSLAAVAEARAALAPEAAAQLNTADQRGGVSGTLRNDAGSAVAGVTVTATNAANGAQLTATTDAQGAYAFPALPVGTYDLSIVTAGLTAYIQPGVEVVVDQTLALDIAMTAATAAEAADADRQALLERVATLEQRISDLESSTVLSDPETRVRRVEVFVDENGAIQDEPIPGVEPTVTYERERVYRRQTINEKIEEALEDADNRNVVVGVDATVGMQMAGRTSGSGLLPEGNAYALASADLFFTAGIAQYTIFFADIVGLSGSPPDAEIPSLTLLNGYTARLVRQNELNLREAWLRTELFGQRLALTAGTARPDELLRSERARQRRRLAVHQRCSREQPDARPRQQRHRHRRGSRVRREDRVFV